MTSVLRWDMRRGPCEDTETRVGRACDQWAWHSCKPRNTKEWKRQETVLPSLGGTMALLTFWFQTSGSQNCERIDLCRVNCPFCSTLLEQSQETSNMPKIHWLVAQKQPQLPYHPAIPLPGRAPKEWKTIVQTKTWLFPAALVTVAERWKQSKRLPADK